ncbi:hypothetical protein HY486_00710 [Candidatus Woesearchaeota archaeon]|nr:hypothetical protein [Candidatus Woesearchaeota archaeon]
MRKGVEISITMAVILIITILIFGLSLIFLRNVFTGAKDIEKQLQEKTEAEIERLIAEEGSLVAMPYSTTTLKKGQKHFFGIGVRNVLSAKQDFQITVQLDDALINNQLLSVTSPAKINQLHRAWTENLAAQILSIDINQNTNTKIYLKAPHDVEKGTYYFNVCVTLSSTGLVESIDCTPSTPVYGDRVLQIEVKQE